MYIGLYNPFFMNFLQKVYNILLSFILLLLTLYRFKWSDRN